MNAVVAGWLAGYLMGILTTAALTFLATRIRDGALVERLGMRDVPGALLAVPLFTGAAITWTFLGLALGSLYEVGNFDTRPGFAGAPSWVFLLLIGAIAWLPLPVMVMLGRRYWWLWSGLSACFLALFGWLMPVLAERGS